MRPPARPQSALRYPFNEILGTEATVRVLRELVAAGSQPVSAGDLARRTALARTSVYQALKTLERAGLTSAVGSGRQRPVTLVWSHPLAPAIRELFHAEATAFTNFLAELRAAAASITGATAVWLEGPIASGTDRPGDPAPCYVLGDARWLESFVTALRAAIAPIAQRYDVPIPVHGTTRHELALRNDVGALALQDVILLAGTPPAAFHPKARERLAGGARKVRKHSDHDRASIELARDVAARIVTDPGLIARTLTAIERRMGEASPGERHELAEWAELLRSTSPRRLRELLIDPGERMTRLRQSMPFAGLLEPADRARIARED